jgi:hypothetical protein
VRSVTCRIAPRCHPTRREIPAARGALSRAACRPDRAGLASAVLLLGLVVLPFRADADHLADPAVASAVLALDAGLAAGDVVLLAGALSALDALGVVDARPGAGPMAEAGEALAFLARGLPLHGAVSGRGPPAGTPPPDAPGLRLSRGRDLRPEGSSRLLVVFTGAASPAGRPPLGADAPGRGGEACAMLRPWAWICPGVDGPLDLPSWAEEDAVLVVEPAQ